MNKEISSTISMVRFPLILLVIFAHIPRIDDAPVYYHVITSFFSCAIIGILVPVFLMISGYLFFSSEFCFQRYYQKINKHIHSLLIPYLIWNTVALLAIVLRHPNAYEYTSGNVLASFWDCHHSFLQTEGHSPVDFPLWFVRDLMACNLLAPVFYYALKYLKWFFPTCFIILWLFDIQSPLVGLSVISIAFFSLGAYMSMYHPNAISLHKGKWNLAGMTIFLLLCVGFSIYGDEHHEFLNLISLIGCICLPSSVCWITMKDPQLVSRLSSFVGSTFFLFACHAIIIKPIYNLLERWNYLPEIGIYFLTWIITVGCCYGLWLICSRFFPKFSKIINGR